MYDISIPFTYCLVLPYVSKILKANFCLCDVLKWTFANASAEGSSIFPSITSLLQPFRAGFLLCLLLIYLSKSNPNGIMSLQRGVVRRGRKRERQSERLKDEAGS